jgi:hypothetical protein
MEWSLEISMLLMWCYLAKQGWRLAQNPDSSCAILLKAKHFHSTDILHAKPSEGMSYTWSGGAF